MPVATLQRGVTLPLALCITLSPRPRLPAPRHWPHPLGSGHPTTPSVQPQTPRGSAVTPPRDLGELACQVWDPSDTICARRIVDPFRAHLVASGHQTAGGTRHFPPGGLRPANSKISSSWNVMKRRWVKTRGQNSLSLLTYAASASQGPRLHLPFSHTPLYHGVGGRKTRPGALQPPAPKEACQPRSQASV